MNIKEFGKTVFNPKVVGVLSVAVAAVGAAFSTLADQKKEKDFNDLVKRVKDLENK